MVSIPRRDFIGFRGAWLASSGVVVTQVSIPRRDFIGFRVGSVKLARSRFDMFQSLEGILSDLEFGKGIPRLLSVEFQSLEGILSDLELSVFHPDKYKLSFNP